MQEGKRQKDKQNIQNTKYLNNLKLSNTKTIKTGVDLGHSGKKGTRLMLWRME